eukprot:11531-Amphidinium_carterae.1
MGLGAFICSNAVVQAAEKRRKEEFAAEACGLQQCAVLRFQSWKPTDTPEPELEFSALWKLHLQIPICRIRWLNVLFTMALATKELHQSMLYDRI